MRANKFSARKNLISSKIKESFTTVMEETQMEKTNNYSLIVAIADIGIKAFEE